MSVIEFQNPARDLSKVSEYSRSVLRDAMKSAGINRIVITSTARTPAEQARVMFENIERFGVGHQKALYAATGDKIIDQYVASKKSGMRDPEIMAAMTRRIVSVGPGRVSRHASDPDTLNVVDIAPSSIPLQKRLVFQQALQGDSRISTLLTPPKDPAYHVEIPQP